MISNYFDGMEESCLKADACVAIPFLQWVLESLAVFHGK
jgi:hypothetical protein